MNYASGPDSALPTRFSIEQSERILEQALRMRSLPDLGGGREKYRELLARVLTQAGSPEIPAAQSDRARWVLIQAWAASAEDARYGAGQIARGSQRAPTEADCEDGWERVSEIVQHAESCARKASVLAAELATPRAQRSARQAEQSAQEARRLIQERNRAYTFHADSRFSFGEGWYLAAAAVLGRVQIQIEPNQAQSEQAALFLRQAGLGRCIVPYRSRPRANKALPDLVAQAFRLDPKGAQQRLRAAFLGDEALKEVEDWVAQELQDASPEPKVLIWLRYGAHDSMRNSEYVEVETLCGFALQRGLVPILIGDALRGGPVPEGALDLTLFWKLPLFSGANMRRAQLYLFEVLRRDYHLVGQMGVTTAGMDGPALMGLATMYLTQQPNCRLGKWVGVVPGYEEVVREAGYLEQIRAGLDRFCDQAVSERGSLC